MRFLTKTAASFMILVLLLMPSKLWAQDPPKKIESPPPAPDTDRAKVVVKDTWLTCYWSSMDEVGESRRPENKSGVIACGEARDLHIVWESADVCKPSHLKIFLKYVGSYRLPDPFADRLIVQRFFQLEGGAAVASKEFIVLRPQEDPAIVRKKVRDYVEHTANPPTPATVAAVEWCPPPAADVRVQVPTPRSTQPSERVVSPKPNK